MTFTVPDKTSINKEEFKPELYTIAFAPELIEFILKGQKLTTYRFGDKYDYLQIGDLVKVQDSTSKAVVCEATITDKSSMTFSQLPVTNGLHESYKDKEHQREVLSGYYAYLGRPINDDDAFLEFEFKLALKF